MCVCRTWMVCRRWFIADTTDDRKSDGGGGRNPVDELFRAFINSIPLNSCRRCRHHHRFESTGKSFTVVFQNVNKKKKKDSNKIIQAPDSHRIKKKKGA